MPLKHWFGRVAVSFILLSGCAVKAQPIVLATGENGGLYHLLGELLADKLKASQQLKMVSRNTRGSNENLKLVEKGQVDFAIVQAGTDHFADLEVVTPLFVEPVMVLSKRNVQVNEIGDLNGKVINLGVKGSGSRVTAERVLAHHEIENYTIDEGYVYSDKSMFDVSIVVGGLLNADIRKVIKAHRLKVLPIQDSKAIALKHTHLRPYIIPRGVFSQNPAIPAEDIQSIAATAILVARKDIADETIAQVLKAIYETDLRIHFPLLMTPVEVKQWTLFPLKPRSLAYLDPYRGIGIFANFAESIVAIKEIIFALIAAAYFAWVGWRKRQAKEVDMLYSAFKEKLDVFLDESVVIERKCVTQDKTELQLLLNQAIALKHKALTELTNEKLRGDNLFAIFLSQCSSLILRIEQKLGKTQ